MSDLVKTVSSQIGRRYHSACSISTLKWKTEKHHFINIVEASEDLQKCTLDSLESAALQAASMGLSFNRMRQHCYLIPYKQRTRNNNETYADYEKNVPSIAHASPSYRGLSHIAVSSGVVQYMRPQEVYETDYFRYKGPDQKPEYSADPKAFKSKASIKKYRNYDVCVGVFAVARDQHGNHYCEFLDCDQVDRIRNMSKQKNSIMWDPKRLWTEGWKKAAIRRMYKTLPQPDINPRMDAAIQVMDTHEGMLVDVTPEAECYINDVQANTLYSMLDHLELSDDKRNVWLERVAFAVSGQSNYREIPEHKFTESVNKLKEGIEAYETKNAAEK